MAPSSEFFFKKDSLVGAYHRAPWFAEPFIKSDRNLHFRLIVDYTTNEGPLLRFCGIQTLTMTTIAQGRNVPIRIPGVKDCYKVRDMLADIDRLREDS